MPKTRTNFRIYDSFAFWMPLYKTRAHVRIDDSFAFWIPLYKTRTNFRIDDSFAFCMSHYKTTKHVSWESRSPICPHKGHTWLNLCNYPCGFPSRISAVRIGGNCGWRHLAVSLHLIRCHSPHTLFPVRTFRHGSQPATNPVTGTKRPGNRLGRAAAPRRRRPRRTDFTRR